MTVAVFVKVPVAFGLTVPVTVYVIELPAGRLTPVSSMLPCRGSRAGGAAGKLVAYHLSPVKMPVSIESVTVAPLILPGPELLTTTV